MKVLRLFLTILAVAAAAFLAFRGCHGAPPPVAPEPTPTPGPDGDPPDHPFIPLGAEQTPDRPKPADEPPTAKPPADDDADASLAGTPVKPDAEPSLVVPYKTGTKCRYRVTEAELNRDRDSGEYAWGQFVWTVSTEVVQGDGSGAARIRFQIDSFRYYTEAPGRRIAVDSQSPDRKLLDDPAYGLGRLLKPWIATCGVPVEFVIDAGGVIRGIEGASAVNRKFLDVVATFGAQQEQDAVDAPTVENMTERWGAYLFPALGGGKLKADATRDTSFRTTYKDRWAAVASGKLRVTHDDPDAFRVAFVGKPAIEELTRPAVHPSAMNVEKAKVDASADSWTSSWRFDRAHGRLLASRLRAKYTLVVAYRVGVVNGEQQYEHPYTDIERRLDVEILDQ